MVSRLRLELPGSAQFRAWRELRRFRALPPEQRNIVFYAEDAASRVHFDEILAELTGPLGREIAYLTSDADDPVLSAPPRRIRSFFIGDGAVRTFAFLTLEAGVMVMTLPELAIHHLKRSRAHAVHYAYVFHSMVSTHMIYRKGAFDGYDSVLCVGPHHVAEIRANEKLHGLAPKQLVEHGYGRLDALRRPLPAGPRARRDGPVHVLVAPSWSPEGLLETRGVELTGLLLAAGMKVTLRPHPVTRKRCPALMRELVDRFAADTAFELETDIGSQASLHAADVMVSDWSGAALEYAFAFHRPVAFVDVPRKVNNPEYAELACEPLEVSIRDRIGVVVAPDRLVELPGQLVRLCDDPEAFDQRIRRAQDEAVYHVGDSGRIGAEHVAARADDSLARERDSG